MKQHKKLALLAQPLHDDRFEWGQSMEIRLRDLNWIRLTLACFYNLPLQLPDWFEEEFAEFARPKYEREFYRCRRSLKTKRINKGQKTKTSGKEQDERKGERSDIYGAAKQIAQVLGWQTLADWDEDFFRFILWQFWISDDRLQVDYARKLYCSPSRVSLMINRKPGVRLWLFERDDWMKVFSRRDSALWEHQI